MRAKLPVWVLGLANAPYGCFNGLITVAMPILLRAQGVSVMKIAGIITLATSPLFWVFLISPLLDVGLSRKAYCWIFAAVASASLVATFWLIHDVTAVTVLLVVGYSAATMYHYALYGWLTERMEPEDYATTSSACEIASLGGAGLFAAVTVWLERTLSASVAAVTVAALFVLPVLLIALFPDSEHPARQARAVFGTFFGDLYTLLKQRRCRYGLLVFLAPVCSFALPFAAVGVEFHTSEQWSATINGPLTSVACGLGCLTAAYICRRISARMSYVLTGLVAAMVTGAMMPAARTMAVFATGRLLYTFLQGLNFASFGTLLYQIVGKKNPLAGTQLSLLTASSCLPIVYMTALDGVGFAHGGVNGMLAVDTFVAVGTCVPVLLFFWRVKKTGREAAEAGTMMAGNT